MGKVSFLIEGLELIPDKNRNLNRQKVKISFSCMPNVYRNISSLNQALIKPENNLQLKGCNCQAGVDSCPINGNCLTD